MYGLIESLGSRLLNLFVPKVEASAQTCYEGCWDACWQCNARCGYYAPCCGVTCSDGSYDLTCYYC